MRKKTVFSAVAVIFIVTFLFMGCNDSRLDEDKKATSNTTFVRNDEQTKIADEYNISENGEIWNFLDTLDRVVCDEDCYKVYSNKDLTGYYYKILDRKGTVLDYGYYGWRGAEFEQSGDILKMRLLYGGNIGNEKYYDIKNGKVSRIFECVLDENDGLIAYFSVSQNSSNQPIIVIEDVFDPCAYHCEFPRNISDTSLLQHYTLDAKFIDNNTKFQITYQTAGDYKEVTEIIELK